MRKLTKSLFVPLILSSVAVSMAYAQDSEFDPPMLEFGVPDLQGTWSYETRTGLQRPAHYSELEIDEDTMLSTLEPTSEILDDYQNFGTNRQNDPANVGGYDPEYFSIGESLALIDGKYRTSIIIDPPDGRIPYRDRVRQSDAGRPAPYFNFPIPLGVAMGRREGLFLTAA